MQVILDKKWRVDRDFEEKMSGSNFTQKEFELYVIKLIDKIDLFRRSSESMSIVYEGNQKKFVGVKLSDGSVITLGSHYVNLLAFCSQNLEKMTFQQLYDVSVHLGKFNDFKPNELDIILVMFISNISGIIFQKYGFTSCLSVNFTELLDYVSVKADELLSLVSEQNFKTIFTSCVKNFQRDALIRNNVIGIFHELSKSFESLNNYTYKVIILTELIKFNHTFVYRDWKYFLSKLDSIKDNITIEEFEMLSSGINLTLDQIEIEDSGFMTEDPLYISDNLNDYISVIQFLIPHRLKHGDVKLVSNDKYTVEFKRVSNIMEDPMFRNSFQLGISINLMPFELFSDYLYYDKCSLVTISFKGVFAPDFVINNGRVTKKTVDFSDKEAILGRSHHPIKELVVQILRGIKKEDILDDLYDIPLSEINVELVNNYTLIHFLGEEQINLRQYILSNKSSFINARNSYLTSMESVMQGEEIDDFEEYYAKTEIKNEVQLRNFAHSVIELTLGHSLKYDKYYKLFWNNELPKVESAAQVGIHAFLEQVFRFKGIKIMKEPEISNGKVDFLLQFPCENKIIMTCVEVKNAHSPDILYGKETQLPIYMKGSRTKTGIYLVLWYKSGDYTKPEKYDTINDLYKGLSTIKNSKVLDLILDCSIKLPPSRANK